MNNDIPFLEEDGYVPSNEPKQSNSNWVIIAVIAVVSFIFFICFYLTKTSDRKISNKILGDSNKGNDDNKKVTNTPRSNPWITPDGKLFDMQKFLRESQKRNPPPYNS